MTCRILAAYFHQLDPVLLPIYKGFGIRWYGLSYFAGFVVSYLLILYLTRCKRTMLRVAQIGDLTLAIALGVVIGGRLGYCLFYGPELFITFFDTPPWWGVLAINRGGMASHGGMIGLVIACLWFGRRHQINVLHLFDLTVIGGSLGVFFGRIANFINGELIGRVTTPDMPLAVQFPQEIMEWPNNQMLDTPKPGQAMTMQLLEQIKQVQPELIVTQVVEKGNMVLTTTHIRQTFENIVEASRTNPKVVAVLSEILPYRHPSQLYAAALEGLAMFLILIAVWYRPRKPGVLAGVALVVYPIARIVNEQFRRPDLHIGYEAMGLTRGQWLSFGMLAIGLACLGYWLWRPARPIGGWGPHGIDCAPEQIDALPVDSD